MTRFLLAVMALTLAPELAHAYVGPGAGLTAIGSVLAFVGAVLLLVGSVLWYPMKRMIRRRRGADTRLSEESEPAA